MEPVNFPHHPVKIEFGSLHTFDPVIVVDAPEKNTWIGRHVKWLKEERKGVSKVLVAAFAAVESCVLFFSVIGIPLFVKEFREWMHQNKMAEYFAQAKAVTPPKEDEQIELKTKTRAFNQAQEFAIENDILWVRKRHQNEAWKPVYFDGFAVGNKPVSLDCDGANLIVLDENNTVHYKKVLKELRNRSDVKDIEEEDERHLLDENGIAFNDDANRYIAVDKGDRDNWKREWFTLPILSKPVNLATGKRLTLPTNIRAWAISQRGRYNDYLEDQQKIHHLANVGVTTLYALDENGKDIYKFDPWSPKHVRISIPLPETRTTSFEALNIGVSASVIMAIGYEAKKAEDRALNSPVRSELKIYTRLADIDSEGWNPGLKYDYFDEPTHAMEDIIVIPVVGNESKEKVTAGWMSHPLPSAAGDKITQHMTLVQAGAGNDAREMRIEGEHQGQRGFFFKKITDNEWQFESFKIQPEPPRFSLMGAREVSGIIDQEQGIQSIGIPQESDVFTATSDFLPPFSKNVTFESTIHHYLSESVKVYRSDVAISAKLENFGERAYHSKLRLKIGGNKYVLDLHKKKTIRNFIGLSGDAYDLVIPKKYHGDKELMDAFKGKKVISLNARNNDGKLILEGPFDTNFRKTVGALHRAFSLDYPVTFTFSRGKK